MKFKFIYAVVFFLLGMAVWQGITCFKEKPTEQEGIGSYYPEDCYLNGNSATTSPTVVLTQATTTSNTCTVEGLENVRVNLLSGATTTGHMVWWQIEFSQDGVDWWGEDANTDTSDVTLTHGSTTVTRLWDVGSTSTTTKSFLVKNVASKFMRLKYRMSGYSAFLWGSINRVY